MDTRAYVYAFISTALGSLNVVAFRYCYTYVSVLEVAFVECAFLLLFFGILGGWRTQGLSRQEKRSLLLGGICHAAGWMSFYMSIRSLTPIEFSFLGRGQTVVSVLLGLAVLRESISGREWIGILTACLGAAMLTLARVEPDHLFGVMFAILYCVFFGFRGLIVRMNASIPVPRLMFWAAALGIGMILIASHYDGWPYALPISLDHWKYYAIIVTTTIFANAIGISLYLRAIQRDQLARVGAVRGTAPLFAGIYSGIIGDWVWSMQRLFGYCLCAVSLACFAWKGRAPRAPRTSKI